MTGGLAAERDQLVLPAVTAAQPHKAVGQDAALEEGAELVPHKLRQVGARCGLSLLEEGRGVLLHKAIPHGLLRAVALVVDRGAIRCAVGSPVDGLHTRLTRW